MKIYKVLWLDDKHEESENVKEEAYQQGIELIGITNSTEGIKELQDHLQHYDALVVDGLFYETPFDTGDALNQDALYKVARYLDSISSVKTIPWFILSGQDSFTKEENLVVKMYKNNKVYDKNNDDDYVKLWSDIKFEADNQRHTQIRHKYKQVFDLCTEEFIGEKSAKRLLNLLKGVEYDELSDRVEDNFTPIRKVIEKLYSAFHRAKFLPQEVIYGDGSINRCSIFLAGGHKEYECAPVLHPTVAFMLKNVLDVIQDGSHDRDHLRLGIDQYVTEIRTPYLFKSAVFQLLDILIWSKEFLDQNRDLEKNDLTWKAKEPASDQMWIEGKIIKVLNGYGTFLPSTGGPTLSIIPPKMNKLQLRENQVVYVTTRFDDSSAKHLICDIRIK